MRGFLLGLQGFSSVVHELLQNAEDAGATEFHLRFTPEALWVGNDEIFEDEHFAALSMPAAGSKRHEVEKIGSFGIGFTSVYQLTDAPEVMSRGQCHILRPLEDAVDVENGVEHEWATTIRLPWAFTASEVRTALDSDPLRPEQISGFLEEAKAAVTHSAVFLSHVERLRVSSGDTVIEDVHVRKEGSRRVVRTLAREVVYRVHETEVRDQTLERLVLDAERESRVRLAVPEKAGEDFQGYFYASLPTQERTFLPFHLDADFYPHSDRKSLLWDGNDSVKQRWNAAILHAASELLPVILEAARADGAPPLYTFAQACLTAPVRAAQTRAGSWVEKCAQTVRRAFEARPLLLGSRAGWVIRESLTLPVAGLRMTAELQRRVEDCAGRAFPPDNHLHEFAAFFEALGVEVLDADRFIALLPDLLRDAPLLAAEAEVWEAVRPVVAYLRQALEAHPHSAGLLARHRQLLRTLPLAVDAAGQATTIESVWHVEEQWADVLETWVDDVTILSRNWATEAGSGLGDLLDLLTPDSLLVTLATLDEDAIAAKMSEPVILRRLYAFLSSAPFDPEKAVTVPLCRDRKGGFHPATRMVLAGEIRDQFGLVAELDPSLAEGFPTLFTALGIRALDGDRYFTELLVQLAHEQVEQREAILRGLATSPHLNGARREVWREVPIVRTVEGQWVLPPKANFEHPLLERLFPGAYHAVDHDLAGDRDVQKFLKQLGVTSTPTPENLARIIKDRAGEPVTEEALTLRRELVRHALAEPEVLKQLTDVPWLPDDARSRWWPASQLWSPCRRALVGREVEPERAFLGLDLTEEQEEGLGLAEPGVDTVLRHLKALQRENEPLPAEVLPWLEGQEIAAEQVRQLRELPLFRAEKGDREATHFFLKKHKLAPYRGLLSDEYAKAYPRLIRVLGIREEPAGEDYAVVLLEVTRELRDGGRVRQEVGDLVRFCLNQCASSWKRKEPEPAWLGQLRGARVVPVGMGDEQRILRPRDALRLDLPESDLERYQLQDARPYLVRGVGNTAFLGTLGVRGLKDVLNFRLLSFASQGGPSAYTQRVRDLLPAVVRYLHHLHPDRTPADLERDVLRWSFTSLPVIRAELDFPTFTVLRRRQVELEHEVDPAAHTILLKSNADEFAPGVALEQALGLGEAPHLSALLTFSLERAENFLNTHKVGSLPEGFEPSSSLREAEAADPGALSSAPEGKLSGTERPAIPTQRAQGHSPTGTLPVQSGASQPGTGEAYAPSPAPGPPGREPRLPVGAPRPAAPRQTGRHTHEDVPPNEGRTSGGSPALPSAAALRQAGQQSARNAAGRRDRVAGEGKTDREEGQGSRIRRVISGQKRRAQPRFRNYVHVSREGAEAAGKSPSEHNRSVDAVGMQVVTRFELLAGRTPRDCSDDPDGGYDIRSEGPGGVRLIEVKTVSGPWGARGVTMSRKQMHTAFMRDDRFWLYVVECAAEAPRLWCIRNPAWLATSYTFADDWADWRYAEGPFNIP